MEILKEDVESFNFEAEQLKKDVISTDVGVYGTKPEPYFLLVSHKTNGELTEGLPKKSNLVFTVTSYSNKLNDILGKKFVKKLNLNLKDVPDWLSQDMYAIGKHIFNLFEKYNKKEAMEILKEIIV